MLVVNLQLCRFNGPTLPIPSSLDGRRWNLNTECWHEKYQATKPDRKPQAPQRVGRASNFRVITFDRSKILQCDQFSLGNRQTPNTHAADPGSSCSMSIQPRAKRRHATHMHANVPLYVQCEVTHTRRHHSSQTNQVCLQKSNYVCTRDTRAAQRGGLCAHLHNVAKTKRRRQHPHSIVQKNTREDTRANLQTHEDAKHKRTRRSAHECEKTTCQSPTGKHHAKNLSAAVFTSSSPDPLGPSSTETKRMIEHQSPTVTERDSLLRQKPRRLRRSQHQKWHRKKTEDHERAKRVRGDCSASRPKRNPLCRVAVDGPAEG